MHNVLFVFDVFQAKIVLSVLLFTLAILPTLTVGVLVYYLVTSLVATTLTDRAYMRWFSVCLIAYIATVILLGGHKVNGQYSTIEHIYTIQDPGPLYGTGSDGPDHTDKNIFTQELRANLLDMPFESFAYNNDVELAFDSSGNFATAAQGTPTYSKNGEMSFYELGIKKEQGGNGYQPKDPDPNIMNMVNDVNARLREKGLLSNFIIHMFNTSQTFSYAVYHTSVLLAAQAIINSGNEVPIESLRPSGSLWGDRISSALNYKFNETHAMELTAALGRIDKSTPFWAPPYLVGPSAIGITADPYVVFPESQHATATTLINNALNGTLPTRAQIFDLLPKKDGLLTRATTAADSGMHMEHCISDHSPNIDKDNLYYLHPGLIIGDENHLTNLGSFSRGGSDPNDPSSPIDQIIFAFQGISGYLASGSATVSGLVEAVESLADFSSTKLTIHGIFDTAEFKLTKKYNTLEELKNAYKNNEKFFNDPVYGACLENGYEIADNYDQLVKDTFATGGLMTDIFGPLRKSVTAYVTKLSNEESENVEIEHLADLSSASRSLLRPIVAGLTLEGFNGTVAFHPIIALSKKVADSPTGSMSEMQRKAHENWNKSLNLDTVLNQLEKLKDTLANGNLQIFQSILFMIFGILPLGAVSVSYALAYYTTIFTIAISLLFIPFWIVFTSGKMMMIATASEENYNGVSFFPVIQFFGMFALIALEASVLAAITPAVTYYITMMNEFAMSGLAGILMIGAGSMTNSEEAAAVGFAMMLKSVMIFGLLTGLSLIPGMIANLLRGQIYQPSQSARFDQGMQSLGSAGQNIGHRATGLGRMGWGLLNK